VKIFCSDFSEINWVAPSYSINKSVNVWLIDVVTDSQVIEQLKNSLNEEEVRRASRFAFEKDRNQFITAHGTLRTLLSKCLEITSSEIQFKKDKNKKPQILFPLTSLKFNISHSENKILISISEVETGVDVEMIKPGMEFKELIKTYFSNTEQQKILDAAQPAETFYKYWTRKEAVLKASGIGITDELKKIEVSEPENDSPFAENFFITSFMVESFYASIASAGINLKLNFFRI
jgi:4'-phosphopantetheinyl transferase